MTNDAVNPDVAALFEAFSPALVEIAKRITANNEKHGGKQGRLGGRTSMADWNASRCRHALQASLPGWHPDGESLKDHLAAEAFNAMGQLTELLNIEKEGKG